MRHRPKPAVPWILRIKNGARALKLAALVSCTVPSAAIASCPAGIYRSTPDNFAVLGGPAQAPASGQRYLMRDGRRGATGDLQAPVKCRGDTVLFTSPDGRTEQWRRVATRETPTTFNSDATTLAGRLIEPPGQPNTRRPLVILVHGSEKTPAIGGLYAYLLAAYDISVFAYDKRGTGASDGEYTQNFELLADDAAAAFSEGRRMAAGRFGRVGFFGGSQGAWVAPLAATHTPADFVAVAFGLAASPIEEDRDQMLYEAQRMNLDADAMAKIRDLSHATAGLMRSHFTAGFEELIETKRRIGDAPWAAKIQGEYSGDMLRMSDADLRRVGRARFDNLELIWDYDSKAVLQRLNAPLLWILAGDDHEAPIAVTKPMLTALAAAGRPIDLYLFPHTDHGMFDYRSNPDGSRTPLKLTDGYVSLLTDWIKGDVHGTYGRAERLH